MEATTAALLKSLNTQRDHVLGIVEGLSEHDMRRPVLPSGWSCLGLVHHLALDIERFWFQIVVAGDTALMADDDESSAWHVSADLRCDDVLSLYRGEIERANEIIQAVQLEAPPAYWPDFFGSFRLPDLRAILLHVITETSCHAGHLDATRELIDGKMWIVR